MAAGHQSLVSIKSSGVMEYRRQQTGLWGRGDFISARIAARTNLEGEVAVVVRLPQIRMMLFGQSPDRKGGKTKESSGGGPESNAIGGGGGGGAAGGASSARMALSRVDRVCSVRSRPVTPTAAIQQPQNKQ